MATYTVTIPFGSGTVKVDCGGISLCDFHLLSKNIEDFIATRVSQSLGPMRPLSEEERSPISVTSWHTPPIGDLEEPFEEDKPVTNMSNTAPLLRFGGRLLERPRSPIDDSDGSSEGDHITDNNSTHLSESESLPESDLAVVPEGWSGPYYNSWCYGEFKNPETGKKMRFKTFEEAIEAANKFDGCNGITQYPRGFQLRKTANVRTTAKYAGKASWVKTTHEEPCYDSSDGRVSYNSL